MALTKDALGTVEIVLAEATNNIVEHAYANEEQGVITLSSQKQQTSVCFEIIDSGVMFPGGEIPPKNSQDIDGALNTLPEGGFGWGLIHDITTELSYLREGGRNYLNFSIPLKGNLP